MLGQDCCCCFGLSSVVVPAQLWPLHLITLLWRASQRPHWWNFCSTLDHGSQRMWSLTQWQDHPGSPFWMWAFLAGYLHLRSQPKNSLHQPTDVCGKLKTSHSVTVMTLWWNFPAGISWKCSLLSAVSRLLLHNADWPLCPKPGTAARSPAGPARKTVTPTSASCCWSVGLLPKTPLSDSLYSCYRTLFCAYNNEIVKYCFQPKFDVSASLMISASR